MGSLDADLTTYAKLAGCVAVGGLGAWICILNWSVFWSGCVRRERTASWSPLLGAALLSLGLKAAPVHALNELWWLPFVLDWGSLPGLLYTAYWHVRHRP